METKNIISGIHLHKTNISATCSQLELNFWMCKGWSEKAKLRTFATPGLENTFRKHAQHNPREKETTTSEKIFYKKSQMCARTFCVRVKTDGKLRRGKNQGVVVKGWWHVWKYLKLTNNRVFNHKFFIISIKAFQGDAFLQMYSNIKPNLANTVMITSTLNKESCV